MKLVRTTINDDEWHIYLVPQSDMRVIKDDDTDPAATTDTDTKEIHIVEEEFEYSILAHEVFHAYAHYLFLWDTELSIKDYEEVMANLFAYKGKAMQKKTDEIYAALLKLRSQGNTEEELTI